ncbi:MAG: DUF4430 domain-containing protein [Ruminococcaceae bacterium]|nr:DUF4430 domain-containing protein [Oscillospiraceae bacterium]
MKKIVSSLSVVVLLLLCLVATGCQAEPEVTGIWADATYNKDATLGEGAVAMKMVIAAEEKSITLTINTNKETVAEALKEHNLIKGSEGLYTVVNGMTADYNVDQTYWAFYENEAYANQGMDTTKIDPAVTYKLVRSK